MSEKILIEQVTDYWMDNFLEKEMCSLCGQSGIIHTEGIRTPAGLEVGRANFCICPNGQVLRYYYPTIGKYLEENS